MLIVTVGFGLVPHDRASWCLSNLSRFCVNTRECRFEARLTPEALLT